MIKRLITKSTFNMCSLSSLLALSACVPSPATRTATPTPTPTKTVTPIPTTDPIKTVTPPPTATATPTLTCMGPNTQSCSITHGSGIQTAASCTNGTWSNWGTCEITSCNSGSYETTEGTLSMCCPNSTVLLSGVCSSLDDLNEVDIGDSRAFYVSSTDGHDSNCNGLARTAYVSGTNQSCPFKTLTKVNTLALLPGDFVLFKAGDTFYGTLTISKSGSAESPITFSRYGSGEKPIITGFTSVLSWTNLTNTIWESNTPVSTLQSLNMVAINGVDVPMGKFPNENDPNKGYIFYQSHSGRRSLTSSGLVGTPNWTGGEVVFRSSQYALNRRTITSQTDGTITWDSDETLSDGKPFFIQNHPQTLDQQNEWYFNPTTKKIRVFSTSRPVNVNVASIDQLVTISNSVVFVVIDGIALSGANLNAIYRWPFGTENQRAKNMTIRNCSISFSGGDALSVRIDNLLVENNTITDSHGNAIMADNDKNLVIRDNTIRNTAIYKGMTQGWGPTSAISLPGAMNATIEYNRIFNSGYDGINFSYVSTNDVTIKNNLIDTFCTVLNDGGGIYGNRNAKIIGNIVLNGALGQIKLWAYDPWAVGIYLDDNSVNNEVSGNTVYNTDRVGIYLHNTRQSHVHDNLLFNNKFWQLLTTDDAFEGAVENNTIENNIFISKLSNYKTVQYHWGDGSAKTIGTLNNNYYARPFKEGSEITSNGKNMTLAQWKAATGQDVNSKGSPQVLNSENDFQFEYNDTKTAKTIPLSHSMIDIKGKKYSNSITLQPFTSIVLMKDYSSN